jgi:glycosyltransferase involved in cell wall biosynthesis
VGGFTLHPTRSLGGDVFGAYRAAELVQELDAHLVLLLYDFWMLHSHMRTLARIRDRAAIVAYLPIDGHIVDDSFMEPLASIDRFVAYTHFGRAELTSSIDRMRARGLLFTEAPVEVIPHGVDTATFHPLALTIEAQLAPGGRSHTRARLFADAPEWRDAFIVLNANRPLERKRIDLTLEGFATFAQDKGPNVKLWLHHAIMDADEHAGIRALVERFGLTDHVRLSEPGAGPLSDEELNLVYNACDVGINTALGEGWGLVSFEHAATGAAQVVPVSSATGELWEGSAEVLVTEDTAVPSFTVVGMRTVRAGGVAAALERLYDDPEHLRAMSLAAYRNATQPRYGWDAIASEWRALLTGVLAQRDRAPSSVAGA